MKQETILHYGYELLQRQEQMGCQRPMLVLFVDLELATSFDLVVQLGQTRLFRLDTSSRHVDPDTCKKFGGCEKSSGMSRRLFAVFKLSIFG
jgi:hypothetical protein